MNSNGYIDKVYSLKITKTTFLWVHKNAQAIGQWLFALLLALKLVIII